MPLVVDSFKDLPARFARRFATKSSRFGLAVSTGFAITITAIATIGFDHSGSADSLFDLFGSGLGSHYAQTTPAEYSVGGEASFEHPSHRHHRHHRDDADDDHPRHHHHGVTDANADGSGYAPVGSRSMCVRLCDGYAFPVGDYHGLGDRAAHQATCHSQCPGAETALYVMPPGSDSIGDAVRVDNGKNYSQMPDAFHYTSVLDGSCSCHPTSGNRVASILHDFTLRKGDAVMTQTGFKVFHGAGQFPYRRNDFVAASRSPDVSPAGRATFRAIEKASRISPTTFAQKHAPMPTLARNRDSTKQFEHQASR